MNTEAFQHFFGYHFAENRLMWDESISQLTWEQFIEPAEYSHGAIRDQIVHLISVDDSWFSGLRGREIPAPLNPADFRSLDAIRTHWDLVEMSMRNYLDRLTDKILISQPLKGEDENLKVWQVLLQVVNHGTDHRAQIRWLLNELDVKTVSQDYIFYVYHHP